MAVSFNKINLAINQSINQSISFRDVLLPIYQTQDELTISRMSYGLTGLFFKIKMRENIL